MTISGFSINGIKTRLPIIQGGMGVGISMSGLAGAVARQGGIGVISAAQPGFSLPEFPTNQLKANLEALAGHITRAKQKVVDGLVGVNIMCALTNYADYVKVSIENKADLIISGAGLPINLPELTKKASIKIAPIISSLKGARILLKVWDKKHQSTADMVIVEGPKAGGHLGFSLEQLENGVDFDNEVKGIVQLVKEYEEKYEKEIPVVYAGGVYTREDIERCMALGCAGVQMATRFVATEECDASPAFKQAYVDAAEEDIVLVKSPVGMPGRAINNDFAQRVATGEKEKIGKCLHCLNECNPAEIPYCISKALIDSAQGDAKNGLVFCGESAYKIQSISTVGEIMAELFPELVHPAQPVNA